MMLARLRGAALGGLAVLLISGAGVAFAGGPSGTNAPQSVIVQSGSGSAAAGQQVDLQQGDQLAPDNAATTAEQPGVEAPETGTAAESTSAAAESATEPAGVETDGPGGHADAAGTNAAGTNVDHQFQGEE